MACSMPQDVTPLHVAYAIGGSLAGVVMVWLVGSSLEEVTVSPVFAIVFGCLLLMLSAMLLWRLRGSQLSGKARVIVLAGSASVAASGVMCLFLDDKIVHNLPQGLKVPFYTILSACLAFAYIYLLLDMVLLFFNKDSAEDEASDEMQELPIGSDPQLRMVRVAVTTAVGCVVTGLVYGLIFGLLDMEDADSGHNTFRKLTYVLGAVGGLVVAVLNVRMTRTVVSRGGEDDSDEDDFGINVGTGF
eukprot:TRINITY_DN15070_c0_g1_i1.p1 TRINITY_DN15070_c0_g1~~TRINITY_DN15070_c0_g1_i1.p1  ORF type:complete len:262 (+),score=115.14 TRINITY_DN15070_c0_g1_i1:53-787(+)